MKKIFIIILFLLLITGCTKYHDLRDLAIIKTIGITYDNSYTIYAHIIDEIDENNNPKMKIIESNSRNIKEAFDDIKNKINKEIFLSHIDLIIFNEQLNNDNYQEIINYFLSNKEFRNDYFVIFSNDIKKLLENTQYDEVEEMLKSNKESKKIISTSFEEIIKNYLNNKTFSLSKLIFDNEIIYLGNYRFKNNKLERISYE